MSTYRSALEAASSVMNGRNGPASHFASEIRFHDLVGLTQDWVWEIDETGRFSFSGPQIESLLGYLPADIIGLTLQELMPPGQTKCLPPDSCFLGANPDGFWNVDCPFIKQTGEVVLLQASGVPILFGPNREWTGYRGVCREIAELVPTASSQDQKTQLLLDEAMARADHDSLTGLWNRSAFQQRLEEEIFRARRNRTSLSIVLADVDNFKFFNEAYGHLSGDEVLRLIADVVRSHCRTGDAVARLGGDEFAVLLPGMTRKETEGRITSLCDCVCESGYRPAGYSVNVPIGISCGVAVWPEDSVHGEVRADHGISDSAAALLLRADERLYKNKSSGRDMWSTSLREEWKRDIPGFEVLDSLVVAVNIRDRYTLRHSEDVLLYSILIAQDLGLSLREMENLQKAALLHDIGMIGVPERYLRRPGRLTDLEFEAIKLHPAMGAAIVSTVRELGDVLPAIQFHHERWSGAGYPFGVSGAEIPLAARILAVADAFSAVTTDRPFRVAMTASDAAAILQKGSGTQWDPVCVDAFLNAYFG